MSEAVAYRFRDPDLFDEWCHAGADELDEESRKILEEKGWQIQPLVVLEDSDDSGS